MDFILMDIKNFLKKLENGQLEIEAGQWELHRDIANMRKMVNELKSLKEELGKMRMSSQQQMGLIKELQDKFNVFQKIDSEDPSIKGSTAEFENYKDQGDPEPVDEGDEGDEVDDVDDVDEEFEKQKCRLLPSDEILEIATHASKVKSEFCHDSDMGMIDPQGIDDEDVEFTMEGFDNSYSDGSRDLYLGRSRKPAMNASEERLSSPHYITSSINQDILHRYLQDSAKYLAQKTSDSITFQASGTTLEEHEFSANEDSPSFGCDDCSSVLRVDSEAESHDSKTKLSSLWKRKPGRMSHSVSRASKKCSHKVFDRDQQKRRMSDKPMFCRTCGKDFSNRSRLKKHVITHWMAASANGKGFKCSYCKKICPTPETLTQHLRRCRIITRSYNRMK